MSKILNYISLLIKNDSGYNSKTQIMIWGVFLISIVIFSSIPLIYLSAFYHFTIPWVEISAFITALQTLQGVLIWGKVKTDQSYYNSMSSHHENVEENETQDPQEG